MNLQIEPKKILLLLLAIIATLLLFHSIFMFIKFYMGHDWVFGLSPLFYFDHEQNVPTLYSSCALVLASILLAVIARFHNRSGESYVLWLVLSLIFLFLSIDETALLHEQWGSNPLREVTGSTGLLKFSWVVSYAIAVLIFVAFYIRFLFRLPRKTAYLFVFSGFLYVLGAIGFEMLGGRQYEIAGTFDDVPYMILSTCEELLEMIGIAFFIYTLLNYISIQFENPTVQFME